MAISYESIVDQFLYAELPIMKVDPCVRFEAIAAEVFGSKQRRYGPMPSPEVQVSIRDIIRKSGDRIILLLDSRHPLMTTGEALAADEGHPSLVAAVAAVPGITGVVMENRYTMRVTTAPWADGPATRHAVQATVETWANEESRRDEVKTGTIEFLAARENAIGNRIADIFLKHLLAINKE